MFKRLLLSAGALFGLVASASAQTEATPVDVVTTLQTTVSGWITSVVPIIATIVAAAFVLWAIPKFVTYVKRSMR